jgi:hypothetical protein
MEVCSVCVVREKRLVEIVGVIETSKLCEMSYLTPLDIVLG